MPLSLDEASVSPRHPQLFSRLRISFKTFSRQFSVTACGILDGITMAGITMAGITIAVLNDGTARAVAAAVAVAAAAAAVGGEDTLSTSERSSARHYRGSE